jgi:hypothetical protein
MTKITWRIHLGTKCLMLMLLECGDGVRRVIFSHEAEPDWQKKLPWVKSRRSA